LFLFVVVDGHGPCRGVADDEDLPPPACDGGVEEVALEENVVLFQYRKDDDRKLASLGFVNAPRVGLDGRDDPHVPIEDILIIIIGHLDDAVADGVNGVPENNAFCIRVEAFLKGGLPVSAPLENRSALQ